MNTQVPRQPEDARNLVETATLAGAVIGSGKPFKEGESQLKKTYQIEKQSAYCSSEVAQRQQGTDPVCSAAVRSPETSAARIDEPGFGRLHPSGGAPDELGGGRSLWGPRTSHSQRDKVRWGKQAGYCVVGGQKVPLQRPRVRDVRQREVPLGSYEMLQQASLMEEAVWQKIMHGLTTRRYSEVTREIEQAYGIEKSTVSEHFIEASRQRLQKLERVR